MNSLRILRAAEMVNSLTVAEWDGKKHTALLVRNVRDEELLTEEVRDLLTAYSWHLEANEPPPRSSRPVLSLLLAIAEAEEDAFELSGENFERKHGFSARELRGYRQRAMEAGRAVLEVLP